MATRSQKVKLGVFLTSAFVLFFAIAVILTGLGLFEQRSTYFIDFHQSVSGLAPGMPVKLSGVRVGTVKSIGIDPNDVEVVEVAIQVKKGTPIKTDTVAYINMQGITGLKFIELKDGTNEADFLPPGSEIQDGEALISAIKDRATDIAAKTEKVLSNVLYLTREENLKSVDSIVDNTEDATENLAALSAELTKTLRVSREIALENREAIASLIANANQTSAKSTQVLNEILRLSALAHSILDESNIPQTVAEFRQTNDLVQGRLQAMAADGTMSNLSAALDQLVVLLKNLSETVRQNKDQVRATIDNLREASESFKNLARSLNAQPSRLIFDEPPEPRELP
jgi:phospholipid/cholesterol/gamma-HCH transport system substrate-binding protein